MKKTSNSSDSAIGEVVKFKGQEWKVVFHNWTRKGEYMAKLVSRGQAPVWVDGFMVARKFGVEPPAKPVREDEPETTNGNGEGNANISEEEISLLLSGLALENARFRKVLEKRTALGADKALARRKMKEIFELRKKIESLS